MRISIFIYPGSQYLQRKKSPGPLQHNPTHLLIRHLDHSAVGQLQVEILI